MTLIISEVSPLGFVMLADSAVTSTVDGEETVEVDTDIRKIKFSERAKISVAMWGETRAHPLTMDYIVERKVQELDENSCVDEFAEDLVEELNFFLDDGSTNWDEEKRGIHICGFKDGLPVLYHIHTGHEFEVPHRLQLYKDFPDLLTEKIHKYGDWLRENQKNGFGLNSTSGNEVFPYSFGTACVYPKPFIDLPIGVQYKSEFMMLKSRGIKLAYESISSNGFFHLRNGLYEIYATFFDCILKSSVSFETDARTRTKLPARNLEDRVAFYETHIQYISEQIEHIYGKSYVGGSVYGVAMSENKVIMKS